MAWGTGPLDPLLPFKGGPTNGREAQESGLRLKAWGPYRITGSIGEPTSPVDFAVGQMDRGGRFEVSGLTHGLHAAQEIEQRRVDLGGALLLRPMPAARQHDRLAQVRDELRQAVDPLPSHPSHSAIPIAAI
jgi:hypothetical protein